MLEVVFVFNPEAEFSLISSERANQKREQATRPSVLRGEEVGPPRECAHSLLSWSVSLWQANRSTCQKPGLQFTSTDSLWDVERKPGAFFSRTEFVLTQESKRLQKCFAHDEELTSGAASFPAGSPWVSLGFGRP